jgi:hypothetical protein
MSFLARLKSPNAFIKMLVKFSPIVELSDYCER